MNPILLASDLVAITVLIVLYLRRQGRRELISSFLVTNVGVLAVATALSTGTVSAGLGLGLFGVLSIIRLRSEELAHREIAYYFASLSLGLLGGVGGVPLMWGAGLMCLVLVAVAIGDYPRVAGQTASADLVLDQAVTSPELLTAWASSLINGEAVELAVRRVDTVNDTTTVHVRYRPAPGDDAGQPAIGHPERQTAR